MFNLLWMFAIKYFKNWILVIFYKAIMHKMEFGQAYCQALVKIILNKCIFYFYDIYSIFYEF
jgi:hypothetical protein